MTCHLYPKNNFNGKPKQMRMSRKRRRKRWSERRRRSKRKKRSRRKRMTKMTRRRYRKGIFMHNMNLIPVSYTHLTLPTNREV